MNTTRFTGACSAALLVLALDGCADTASRSPTQPPNCRAGQLTLRAGTTDAGMGHVTQTLVLERRGSGTCRLIGIPRVQLLDARGAPLPTVQRSVAYPMVPGRMPPMIHLAPGQTAHFTVHYANATGYGGPGAPRCPTSAALAVTPPGARSALRLTLSINAYGGLAPAPICGELQVSALRPGAS